jgi:hypothetical protein
MAEKEKFLPFIAINEFMRDDYRIVVISEVLNHIDKIPGDQRNVINQAIAKYVKVPGFRNSKLAPAGLKARSSTDLFTMSNDYVGAIIEGWYRLHLELASAMFEVLTEKKWDNLQTIELDRSKLPGFQIHWPKEDNFEVLIDAVRAKKALESESDDDISLAAVWTGLRLPYDLFVENLEGDSEAKTK